MEVFILLAALIVFRLFVRHDQSGFKKTDPKPLSRTQMQEGFLPGTSVAWKGHAGVALLAVIGSTQQFLTPSLPPFSGKWSFFNAAIYAALGKYGFAMFWAVGALAFAAVAFSKYKAVARKQ